MKRGFQKIAFLIWPPYEAYIATKFIEANELENHQKKIKQFEKSVRQALQNKRNIKEIETIANQVYDSEVKRGEYLENKAQTFIAALGISLSIVSALPVLFDSKSWGIPKIVALIISLFYGLSIIHFLIAVGYSINARRVEGLALPNADEFLKDIKTNKVHVVDHLVKDIVRAKYNEPIFLLKSNSVSVAETMFKRGLIFVSIASIMIVGVKLLVELKLV